MCIWHLTQSLLHSHWRIKINFLGGRCDTNEPLLVLHLFAKVPKMLPYFCSDDEHSDREPKRDRHVCITLQLSICCGKKDDRPITRQRLQPVHVSLCATEKAAMEYAGYVDLWNCPHDFEPLHCRHISVSIQESKNHYVPNYYIIFVSV